MVLHLHSEQSVQVVAMLDLDILVVLLELEHLETHPMLELHLPITLTVALQSVTMEAVVVLAVLLRMVEIALHTTHLDRVALVKALLFLEFLSVMVAAGLAIPLETLLVLMAVAALILLLKQTLAVAVVANRLVLPAS
jgi:hypothetical protein